MHARQKFLYKRKKKLRLEKKLRARLHSKTRNEATQKNNTWASPKVFDIFEPKHRAILLAKIKELRIKIGKKKQNICLDFSNTEKMIVDATLLFIAEFRRLIKHTGGQVKFEFIPPKSDKISQVLKQIGFCDLIGAANPIEIKHDDVISWRYAHGHKVEGSRYEDILSEYDGEIAQALQEKLFTGITEAMTNVINHAYDQTREDTLNINDDSNDWWMFSQEKDNYLTVSFCDLGAGIPRTLPVTHPLLWKRLVSLGKSNDMYAIDYAIRESISRTLEGHRGHGLGQIVRVCQSLPSGQVVIYSNHGVFSRANGQKKLDWYSDSILGTLIYWKVPLQPKENIQ